MFKRKAPAGITTRVKRNPNDGISHQKPVGFSVLNHQDRVEVKVRPPFRFILLFFPIFWYGFLVVWYINVFKNGEVIMGLFALIHVFAGLFVLNAAFNMIFSRTHILVDEQGFTLKRTPSLKDNSIFIRRDELDQFYVTKSKQSFNLILQAREVEHIDVLTALTSYQHARYVEDFLETQLGIKDASMPGEISKPR